MKKFCIAIILATLTFTVSAYGRQNMKQTNYNFGYRTHGKETIDSIQTNGSLLLDGTKVLGAVQLNGSLEADEASIGSLHVNGQATLKNCLINNSALINGLLVADNTKFQNELSVNSQKVTLRLCSVENLTIRPVEGFNGIQIVDLRNGTKVLGSVIVESGNGEIWLSSNSEVVGNVNGAQVIRK